MSESISAKQIQWFPGHMAKTLRLMESSLKNVDAVVQLLDARIPYSSLNPEIARITRAKPRLYILNKADLADPEITAQWMQWFRARGDGCIAMTSKNRSGIGSVKSALTAELAALMERRRARGLAGAKLRLMVVGIPNVGKSTFINTFAGSASARAEDRPGVTRGMQWVTVDGYELLDMPGVLWKKFQSPAVAGNLAFIGSIKDDILDVEALATSLLGELQRLYPDRLRERYKLTAEELLLEPYDLLEAIGRRRGMLMSGGVVDTERAATMLADEFRAAKLGRVSLEKPPVPRGAQPAAADADGKAPEAAAAEPAGADAQSTQTGGAPGAADPAEEPGSAQSAAASAKEAGGDV